MTETRNVFRLSSLDLNTLNLVLAQIGESIDRMEGLRGTPRIYSPMDGGGNKITNTTPGVYSGEVLTADLSAGSGLAVTPAGLRVDLSLSTTVLRPSEVTVVAGTPTTGDVTYVCYHNDGLIYAVTEVAATPGFDIRFKFTHITDFNQVVLKYNYTGAATHFVAIELYNYEYLRWDELRIFSDTVSDNHYDWKNITGIEPVNYINGLDEVTVRLNHYTAGTAGHVMYVDYLVLLNVTL